MGKGRYLKAAERACTRKARFETAAAAEAFVERRFRAYRCVVCGKYHLTSGRGERPEPVEPPRKEPPGPKLGDLDWSAVLDPQPKPPKRPRATPPVKQQEPVVEVRQGVCSGVCGKDGRVLLVIDGKLIKSKAVDRSLRPLLSQGVRVEVSDDAQPRVLSIRSAG